MADILQDVSPNRMELLRINRRLKLAEKGHGLLKEKRDALMSKLASELDNLRGARKGVDVALSGAYRKLSMAQAFMGPEEVYQISLITTRDIELGASVTSVMGVRVPRIEMSNLKRSITERGYNLQKTSSALDECSAAFEQVLEMIIKLAETEEIVRKIVIELSSTRRRVNALEYNIVPKLRATARHILMRLDEMERENFTRMKKIKKLMAEKMMKGSTA